MRTEGWELRQHRSIAGTLDYGSIEASLGRWTLDYGSIAGTLDYGSIEASLGHWTLDYGSIAGTLDYGSIAGTLDAGLRQHRWTLLHYKTTPYLC